MHRRLVGSLAFLIILLTLAASAGVAHATPISQKRAQYQQAVEQIQALDTKLELAVERYNEATAKLTIVKAQIAANKRRLTAARFELAWARQQLRERVVALYKQRPTDVVDVFLGSKSFDDLLTQIAYMEKLGAQDAQIVDSIERLKARIVKQRAALLAARKEAARLVERRKSERASVATALQARQELAGKLKSEIRRMEAEARAAARAAARRAAAAAAAAQQAAQAAPQRDAPSSTAYAPPPGSGHSGAVAIAQRYLGVPYVWGGASPSGFDCSGLTMYVYAQLGISLPHAASMQYGYGTHVSRSQLAPGDLVFFGVPIHHVGIYAGGGSMIHAPHTGAVVRYDPLHSDFSGATRL
ncbi:MAG TPA: NlpC/P60 family protein [Thermoleophilia bacterium]|nr:NlpC/P60 family protein [Thermoleophilia bacterium]